MKFKKLNTELLETFISNESYVIITFNSLKEIFFRFDVNRKSILRLNLNYQPFDNILDNIDSFLKKINTDIKLCIINLEDNNILNDEYISKIEKFLNIKFESEI